MHAVTLPDLFDTSRLGRATPPRRGGRSKSPPPPARRCRRSHRDGQRGLAALGSVLARSLRRAGKAPLSDLVLMAEGVAVSGSEHQAYLGTVDNEANTLSGLVSLPFGRTITMTSLQAKIPISIVSNAKTPFRRRVERASPDWAFRRATPGR